MLKSVAIFVIFAAVVVNASPQRKKGDKSAGPPGGGQPPKKGTAPPLPDFVQGNVTALASAINDAALTKELTDAVSSRNVSTLSDLLLSVAAGERGGNEAAQEMAEDIMQQILPGPPGSSPPGHDHPGGSSEECNAGVCTLNLEGPPPNRGPALLGAQLVEIKVALRKLTNFAASSDASQAQKDIAKTVSDAVNTYKVSTQAAWVASFGKASPFSSDQMERDVSMLEVITKAAKDLSASTPAWTDLSDAISRVRNRTRAEMKLRLGMYQAALNATNIADLQKAAADLDALKAKYASDNGPTSASAKELVEIMNRVVAAIDTNLSSTTLSNLDKMGMQTIRKITAERIKIMQIFENFADRVNAALNSP